MLPPLKSLTTGGSFMVDIDETPGNREVSEGAL